MLYDSCMCYFVLLSVLFFFFFFLTYVFAVLFKVEKWIAFQKPGLLPRTQDLCIHCLLNISTWMSVRHLKLICPKIKFSSPLVDSPKSRGWNKDLCAVVYLGLLYQGVRVREGAGEVTQGRGRGNLRMCYWAGHHHILMCSWFLRTKLQEMSLKTVHWKLCPLSPPAHLWSNVNAPGH